MECGGGGYGQLVAAVIHRVVRMSLDPDETDAVTAVHLQKAHPQICVETFLEPLALPAEDPALVDRVHHIPRVTVQDDLGIGTPDRFQTDDDSHQFHTVVGGLHKAPGQFLIVFSATEYDSVTARPGIAPGRAVGKYLYRQQLSLRTHRSRH